jgi:hypothetical protein
MNSTRARIAATLRRRPSARVVRIALVATLLLVTVVAGMLWATYRGLGPGLRDLLEKV